jgi:hypothetical protein
MLVYEDQLVVMPLLSHVDDTIEDVVALAAEAGAGAGAGGAPGGDVSTDATTEASTLRGLASVDAAAAAVQQAADQLTGQFLRRPYVVSLSAIVGSLTGRAGLQGAVHDIAFLHCYFQPTIAVLQVSASWAVRCPVSGALGQGRSGSGTLGFVDVSGTAARGNPRAPSCLAFVVPRTPRSPFEHPPHATRCTATVDVFPRCPWMWTSKRTL